MNLRLPEFVRIELLLPTGEPFRCADLLFRVLAVPRGRNPYRLGPFPTDSDGVAQITSANLQDSVADYLDEDLMGHYPIEDCLPEVQISLWTPDDIRNAQRARTTVWTGLLAGEKRRWRSMHELLALNSRALLAVHALTGFHLPCFRAEWTDPTAKHSYALRLQQSNAA